MTDEHVAVSDCERIRPGFVAQPANASSSLAFCLVGVWIWSRAGRSSRPGPWRALAATAGVVGLGSAAYHGPGGPVSRAVHDGSNILLVPATVATIAADRRPSRPWLGAVAALCAGAGLVVHTLSRTGGPLCRPDSVVQGHAAWHVMEAAALLALAAAHLTPEDPKP